MEYAMIVPKSITSLTRFNKYHLVLAQTCLEHSEILKFFKMRSECGDTVILDNGAYEDGESMDLSTLQEIAEFLKPTHIILPDVRFDAMKTLRLTKKAITAFSDSGCQLIGVPQGTFLDEVLYCYNEMLSMPAISGFGIYEEIGQVTSLGRRYEFCNFLEANNLVQPEMFYHMLGCEENFGDALKLKEFPWINGIDSAKPIVYGLNNMLVADSSNYVKYPHRPKNYFEEIPSFLQYEYCLENVKWCLKEFGGVNQCAQSAE